MSGESRAAREQGWNGGPLLQRSDGRGAARLDTEAAGRLGAAAVGAVRRTVSTLRLWRERAHQRRALAMLDDRLLRDIGLTRFDVANEIRKPFWRP
jgi:uncharacterized protein YjiS (DUF1127 family)